jgi:hypothetical protein
MAKPQRNTPKYSPIEIAGACLASMGLLAALSWYLGASENRGYYSAYMVPMDLLDISNNEMIGTGANLFVIFLLGTFMVILFQMAIASNEKLFSKPIDFLEHHIFKRFILKRRISLSYFVVMTPFLALLIVSLPILLRDMTSGRPLVGFVVLAFSLIVLAHLETNRSCAVSSTPDKVRETTLKLFPFLIMLIAVVLYLILTIQARNIGYKLGCEEAALRRSRYTIYSDSPLPLENGTMFTGQNALYEYSGYYGFTGDEFLILYNSLDSETNLPLKTYFVRKTAVQSFSIETLKLSNSDMERVADKCEKVVGSDMQQRIFLANTNLLKTWTKSSYP